MQKKIIALAIAGLSSAAFAQTNVTISGNIDLGYQNVNTQTAAAGKDTQQSWVGNGSSTSTLVFTRSGYTLITLSVRHSVRNAAPLPTA